MSKALLNVGTADCEAKYLCHFLARMTKTPMVYLCPALSLANP